MANTMKIYLDLDGPILDIRWRSWVVHCRVVEELGGKPVRNWLRHWQQKQVRTKKGVMLAESGLNPNLEPEYLKRFVALVELEEYLSLDQLIPGVREALDKLSKSNKLVLVTLRQNPTGVKNQIKKFKLGKYFSKLSIGGQREGETTDQAKKRIILSEAEESGKLGQLLVGDTEGEILAAKALTIPSVAILGGIRSDEYLAKLNPTFTIKHLRQLRQIIVALQNYNVT